MADKIQFRRDTAANWSAANPVLSEGELGLVTDTMTYKIGDGITAWNSLGNIQLSGDFTAINMEDIGTGSPSTPPSGITQYAGQVGGRILPKIIGPSGISTALQPLLARNKVGYWNPPGNATTVPGVFGFTAYTALGTATLRNVAVTNLFNRMRRLGFVSAATAASLCGARAAVNQVTLGDGALGGFHKVIRFGISDAVIQTVARMFVGVAGSSAAPTNVEPSTLTNVIGVGKGAADNNLKLFYGGSAAQAPIDLGANFPANTTNTDVYELALFAPPGGNINYEVTRVNTGHKATGTLLSAGGVALPAPATLLTYSQNWRCNNTAAVAVGLDIMSDYIETDD
jgi:hypothetical protein